MKYSKYWIIVASKLLLIWQEIFYSVLLFFEMIKPLIQKNRAKTFFHEKFS